MLGSMKTCSNCHGTDFRRIKINRTVQCENCKLILEERCMSDLMEFHAVTQTEEVYCVVTPDFLHNHLVDDIPNDPYCTPGFISAFRMLSPLREPVYAASSRTLNGALAEMERLIGDALFAGYVGYNGRAPGVTAAKKEEPSDSSERNKSGGDARHTLVAYFEIVELASILCMDKETTNLAIRIFRHTASNTSLRNRNVESLATAAFVSAADRRWHEYQTWLKEQSDAMKPEVFPIDPQPRSASAPANTAWPVAPRHLSVEEISAAANLDTSEVLRYLKVVNVALRKQRSESNSSITGQMPLLCQKLDLPERTQNLAIAIAENAMNKNICSRRNPPSVSAAAIYLACQLDGVRKTQSEICRVIDLTEVTLRKVHKEMNPERDALLPDWYKEEAKESEGPQKIDSSGTRMPVERPNEQSSERRTSSINAVRAKPKSDATTSDPPQEVTPDSLVPPPLPPGFGEGQPAEETWGKKVESNTAKSPTCSTENRQLPTNPMNPLLAMMNNPAMQAFASAFSMMPQLMMPPPPPPLPPSTESATEKEQQRPATKDATNENSADKSRVRAAVPTANRAENKETAPITANKEPSAEMMASMQSMMGVMQAMQAFQSVQQQKIQNGEGGQAAPSQWTIMANALAETQQPNAERGGIWNPSTASNPQGSSSDNVATRITSSGPSSSQQDNAKTETAEPQDDS